MMSYFISEGVIFDEPLIWVSAHGEGPVVDMISYINKEGS